MSHQAQHVTNDRNSDETSASKAAAPMQSSNFSNFDPNHQWHFNDPFDFENNIYAQPHITNYAPALSERTDANAFDALTNNDYTDPSIASSFTLSPVTPAPNHQPPALSSQFPYSYDCCNDFDVFNGTETAFYDHMNHAASDCHDIHLHRKISFSLGTNAPGHIEAALTCADSPPCTNPTCEEIVWCAEEAGCCFDAECLAGEPCDREECAVEEALSPPCYDSHCVEPPCSEAHTIPLCLPHHQSHGHGQGVAVPCTCVDPACLMKDHVYPDVPLHQYSHVHDDGFLRPAKRRKVTSSAHLTTKYHDLTPIQQHLIASESALAKDKNLSLKSSTTAQPMLFNPPPYQANHGVDITRFDRLPPTNSAIQSVSVDLTQHICKWAEHGPACGAILPNEEALQQHVESEHISDPTKQTEYLCYWDGCCEPTHSHSFGPLKSEQTGETADPCSCETCKLQRKGFGTRPKLKRHVQVHTGYKPFHCEVCGTQMKTRDALVKHARTHTGEKPYACTECLKCFATTTELKTHSTVHTGEKPHICPECGERFADSSNLSKHKKTHFSGMFHCEECSATMKRWDQMKRHIEQRKHMVWLLTDAEANRKYKEKMAEGFKPERVETRMELKKRREGGKGRSASVMSEAAT